jgi:hypothetical protein
VPIGEGLRRDGVEVGALRPEVVVDHIEHDHQAARVRRLHQGFQVLGAAVGTVRRIGQHAVIAPVPPAREIRNRHDLDGSDPERDEVVELADGGAEGALRREGADVQLVDHRLIPGPAAPDGVTPGMGEGGDHLARSVHVLGLVAGGRVGHAQPVRQHEAVACAGSDTQG